MRHLMLTVSACMCLSETNVKKVRVRPLPQQLVNPKKLSLGSPGNVAQWHRIRLRNKSSKVRIPAVHIWKAKLLCEADFSFFCVL
jgi:hypothetical protein